MSRRGLSVGSRVIVGLKSDRKWTGTVIAMKRGEKRGDWQFLISRDHRWKPSQEDEAWVIDKYVRPLNPDGSIHKHPFAAKTVVIPPDKNHAGRIT